MMACALWPLLTLLAYTHDAFTRLPCRSPSTTINQWMVGE
jgi:hypothetical protein